jgi:hypothetical protein
LKLRPRLPDAERAGLQSLRLKGTELREGKRPLPADHRDDDSLSKTERRFDDAVRLNFIGHRQIKLDRSGRLELGEIEKPFGDFIALLSALLPGKGLSLEKQPSADFPFI